MPIHVAIHDVCPSHDVELEQAILLCRARGVQPALVVAPESFESGRSGDWLRFARRLRTFESAGSEILLCAASPSLEESLARLRRLELSVSGFVPSAGFLSGSLVRALAAHEIRYAEDRFSVVNPVTGKRRGSLLLQYSTRMRSCSGATVSYIRAARLLRHTLPLRLAIRPSDMRSPLALRELVRLLDWARGDYLPRVAQLLEIS